MNTCLRISYGLLLLLAACGSPHAPAETSAPATPPVAAPEAPQTAAPSAPTPPAHLWAAYLYETPLLLTADTVLRWQGHPYRLRWQVRLDTLRSLTHVTPPNLAKGFAGDTTHGYEGTYTVEVRDSLGYRLGRHVFTKASFYRAVGPELAISSYAELPQLLGYSAPLGGLVFTIPFNAPGTDWYGEAVLVLDPTGQVRYMGEGPSGGPDLTTTLSGDGRTLLTATDILRAGQPPLPLQRAGAELRGARLLNDTLALLLYEPGRSRTMPNGMPYLEASPAQRHQPNAFVRDVRTGREVSHFRYDGFYEELGYIVPWTVVPRVQAAYLLDADKGLYVLPLHQPTAGRLLPFTALPRATRPPTAREISFNLMGPQQAYRFLVDSADATRVRCQVLAE